MEEDPEVLEPLNPHVEPTVTEVGGRFNVKKVEAVDLPPSLPKQHSLDDDDGHDDNGDKIENLDDGEVDLELGDGRQYSKNSGRLSVTFDPNQIILIRTYP